MILLGDMISYGECAHRQHLGSILGTSVCLDATTTAPVVLPTAFRNKINTSGETNHIPGVLLILPPFLDSERQIG